MTPGGVVYLATPGATENYLGNWLLDTQGTSLSEPVTLEPAPGVASPILNGNNGSPFGCQTVTCDGTVFAIGYASEAPVYAVVQGVTFEGAILGAMANEGVLTVMNCTFSDNAATAGAGIYNDTGLLYVSGSTFVDNTAMDGGAIYDAEGLAYVTTSTFYSNTANVGGAIKTDYGPVIVWASTFSANTANMYGNTIDDQPNGIVQAAADIFDGSCNQASGTEWDDEGYNVSSDATCLNAGQGDVDHNASLTSLLGVLSNNGGPTETMLPLVGNPAIGVVPNPATTVLNGIEIPLCPTTDQRGVSSNTGQPCNAGAVQDITPDGSGTLSITPNILMSPGQQYTFILDYSGAGVIEDGMLQITVLASPTGRQPCVPHAFRHRAGHLQPFTES